MTEQLEGRFWFTAGLMIRRDIRRFLAQYPALTVREDKGWLDSRFVVTGPRLEANAVYHYLRQALSDS